MSTQRTTDYLQGLKFRYGVDFEHLAYLNKLKLQSKQAKARLWQKLTGFQPMAEVPMSINLGAPPGYGADKVGYLLLKLKDKIPEEYRDVQSFLFSAIHRIRSDTDVLLVDPINNLTDSGAKVSKLLLKHLKKLPDHVWDSIFHADDVAEDLHLPSSRVSRDVYVQRLFDYIAKFRVVAELSLEWDDFANGAQTKAFGSCYKVGDVQERAPFTLALSPNVAVLRLVNERGVLMGRTWVAFNAGTDAFTFFGAYGIESRDLYTFVSGVLSSKLGINITKHVDGFIHYDKSEQEKYSWQEINGKSLDPADELKLNVVADEFERRAIKLDPIIYGATANSTTRVISISLPHVRCPVCGCHGPERGAQIICKECAQKLQAGVNYATRSYRAADFGYADDADNFVIAA